MKCSYLPPKDDGSGCVNSSSVSATQVRGGDKITYTLDCSRHWFPQSGGFVTAICYPHVFSCPGSISCTVNGVAATGSGGAWYNPITEYFDGSNSVGNWVFNAVFEIDPAYSSCATEGVPSSGPRVGCGNTSHGWHDTYPVNIGKNGKLEEEERERNSSRTDCPNAEGSSTTAIDAGGNLFSYTAVNSGQAPASMGWGWTMGANRRVVEDTSNDDIIFYDGSGSFERWKKLTGGTYQARYPDNYATLVKDGGGVVTITLKNKVELTFRSSDGKIVSEVDRNGNTMTYSYDGSDRLASYDDGEGRVRYFDYTGRTDGQPVGIREQNATTGRLTTLTYNNDDLLWKVTDPEGDVWEFLYNEDDLLWKQIDPRGKVALEYVYDDGKVVERIEYEERKLSYSRAEGFNDSVVVTITEEDLTLDPDPNPRVTVSTFDKRLNLVSQVDPLGNEWLFKYEDFDNPYLLTEQVDPNGNPTAYDYDSNGNLTSVMDAQGNTTTMTYVEGYLVKEIQRPAVTVDSQVITYDPTVLDYDSNGNLISVTDTYEEDPVVTEFEVGSDGRIESVTNRLGQTTLFEYTTQSGSVNAGNLRKVTLPAGPNSAPAREMLFSYDHYDNVIEVEDAAGNTVNYDFDLKDRLTKVTDALGHYVDYSYLDGLLDFVELPSLQGSSGNRRRTRYTRDDAGRVLQVLSKTGTSSEQMRVRHEYDGRSNLKKLIRLQDTVEKAYEFSYDVLDRPVQQKNPLNASNPLEGISSIVYDPYCRNYSVTSARGVETMISRDSLCRITEIQNADEKREFIYDEWSRLVQVVQTRHPDSLYSDASNPPTDRPPSRFGKARYSGGSSSETTTYLYDELDRLVQVTYPDNKVVSYEYDLEGRMTQLTDMLGNVTQYSYYNDGRLYQVTVVASPSNQVFTYEYDLAGRISELEYPTDTGVVAKFSDSLDNPGWNANGQLTHLRYLKGGNLLRSFAYDYDDSGNRKQMVDTPAAGSPVTWDYTYDWLNRLASVSKDSTTQSVYAYDHYDNRVELQLPVLSQTHEYTYDLADRILNRSVNSSVVETFQHDADGNMIARTASSLTTTYQWDSSNKLVAVETPTASKSYRYDSEGIRKKSGSDTRHFSSGAMSLADLRPTNSIGWIQGHQLLGFVQGGDFYWYLTDGLSSVRLVVDADGDVQASTDYDEFGREVSSSGAADLRQHTFTGGLGLRNEMAELGLLYARQRWYDPQLGRWLSQDPIGFEGGLNVYGYTWNDPLNFVDPGGMQPDWTSSDARRQVYGDAFRTTFSWQTLTNFANSMLEVLDLASGPKTKVTTAAIQAASGGPGDIPPLVKKGPVRTHSCPSSLPKRAWSTKDKKQGFAHLKNKHGINPHLASDRLHAIKKASGRGPADNVLFDRTGGVYDPVTRGWLGSLTQGGGRR